MCFSSPKTETPPIPNEPDPNKLAAEEQLQEQRRRTQRVNKKKTVLTSPLGVSNFGDSATPSVTLLGRS